MTVFRDVALPRVSVLMPVRNAQRYLDAAIRSVLAQTFADFEFIIVNNGSTDRTADILARHAAGDRRLRLIDCPIPGIVAALNKGLLACRGELIARMDGDDISLPARFARQVAFLDAHPTCVAVGCQALMIDADGAPIGPFAAACSHEAIDRHNLVHGGGGIPHPTVLMRRAAVRALRGYSERYPTAEDTDFFLRLAELGTLANLPEVLFHYRRHAQCSTVAGRRRIARLARQAIVEARQRRGLAPPGESDLTHLQHVPPLHDVYRDWAWRALREGYVATGRKYAWRVFRRNFWFDDSWRLLGAALYASAQWPPAGIAGSARPLASRVGMALFDLGIMATGALRAAVGRLRTLGSSQARRAWEPPACP